MYIMYRQTDEDKYNNNFFVHLFYSALCITDYISIPGGSVDDKLDRIWKEEVTI